MIDTSFLEVTGVHDCNGVQVRNNDIIRIKLEDIKRHTGARIGPECYRYARVGFGVYQDDNTKDINIGFYVNCEGVTVTAGQLIEYTKSFKVVGNRLNYLYAKPRKNENHINEV